MPAGSAGRSDAAPVTSVLARPEPPNTGCLMLAPRPGEAAAGGGGGVVVAGSGVGAGACSGGGTAPESMPLFVAGFDSGDFCPCTGV